MRSTMKMATTMIAMAHPAGQDILLVFHELLYQILAGVTGMQRLAEA